MELAPLPDLEFDFPFPQTLGDEEEAWYRDGADFESVAAIKLSLNARWRICSCSGNPLEDDEDAWARG